MPTSFGLAIIAGLALGLSILAPAKALAETGGTDGGGGHRMEDQYFDNWLREKLMDPTQQHAYRDTVAPIIARIKEQVPQFGKDLEDVLNEKEWYTVKRRKPHLSAARAGILFDAQEAAYQTDHEIYLDGAWFCGLRRV